MQTTEVLDYIERRIRERGANRRARPTPILARVLGISPQAVRQWGARVPYRHQVAIEAMTRQELRAESHEIPLIVLPDRLDRVMREFGA